MKKCFYGLIALSVLLVSCDKQTTKEPFSGEDITKNVVITIDKLSRTSYIDIDTKGEWTLFGGKSTDSIDYKIPLLKETGKGSYIIPAPISRRMYYFLDTREGTAFLAERHLPIQGGYNFRDLGGIRNKDGKYTQWGKIFRSDDLANLTEEDLTYLESISLISVVDFRSEAEVQSAPDVVPTSVKNHYAYSITPGNLNIDLNSLKNLQLIQTDSLMTQMNVSFVTDSVYFNRYKDLFKLLMNENRVPLVFHCSAGKDRTGMAAALILYALNIDEVTIMGDYLLSNEYLADKYGDIKEEYPNLAPLFEVKAKYLQAGIDKIKGEYGSVENFLRTVLEVNIEKFQEIYLY